MDPTAIQQAHQALKLLEDRAYEELERLGARLLTSSTGHPFPALHHSMTYRAMAYGSSDSQALRDELSHMTTDSLHAAAYLFEIVNFVHWSRTCLAGGDVEHVLAATLERLGAVPIEDLIASWKQAGAQQRGGQTSPKAKAAAVELLKKILREDDDLQAKELWRRAGSSHVQRYRRVELDGERYEFEKDEDGLLVVLHVGADDRQRTLKTQDFNSTFRRWCKEAKEALAADPYPA